MNILCIFVVIFHLVKIIEQFIEVTKEEKKVILNTDWILAIEITESGTRIRTGIKGRNDSVCHYYGVSESYAE